MKQYLITRMQGGIFSFLLCDGNAVEIHCDEDACDSFLGNIYIGRIKNIAKNIGAAFVEIAPGQVCYLPLSDLKRPVFTKKGASQKPQAGDELLVQISREGLKSKFPSVTTNLTLHGKYVLLTAGNCQISVSSKLSKEERERLQALPGRLEPESFEARAYGWIFRTNAGAALEELVCREYLSLKEQYRSLMERAQYRTCFSCLYRTPPAWLGRLSGLYDSEADTIQTDDPRLYQQIKEYLSGRQKEDLDRLCFYEDRLLPMQKLYSLEHQLQQALAERVWLKSGGYLVIQPTEALTVIDVNTGKYEGGRDREASFLKINLEAASEAARQIRLRNLSGIILIDFINMKSKSSEDQLLAFLGDALKKDPVHTVLVDMTKLSLVEITRKKVSKTLLESYRSMGNSHKDSGKDSSEND